MHGAAEDPTVVERVTKLEFKIYMFLLLFVCFDWGSFWKSNVVPPLFRRRRNVHGVAEDFTVVERATKSQLENINSSNQNFQ